MRLYDISLRCRKDSKATFTRHAVCGMRSAALLNAEKPITRCSDFSAPNKIPLLYRAQRDVIIEGFPLGFPKMLLDQVVKIPKGKALNADIVE